MDRRREMRHRRAVAHCESILDGIGISGEQCEFLEIGTSDALFDRFVGRLRDGGDQRERWPAADVAAVARRVEELAYAASGRRIVWFGEALGEWVGVQVPALEMFGAGLAYLVSRASDLMLVSPGLEDGICIELNHLPAGDEYEIVTWGRFAHS